MEDGHYFFFQKKWAVCLERPFFKIWHFFSCAHFLPIFFFGGRSIFAPIVAHFTEKKIENNFWSIHFGRTEILVFEFIWYCKLCVKDGLSKDKGGLSKNQSGMAVGTPLL